MDSEKVKETNRVFYEVIENFDPNQIDMLVRKLTTYNNTSSQQNKMKATEIFNKYGDDITVTCPTFEEFEPVSLREFFQQIADSEDEDGDADEKDVINKFADNILEDAGPDELKIAFNAFILGLKQYNWCEENDIDEDCYIQISYQYEVLYEDYVSNFNNDDKYKIYEIK